MRRDCIEFWWGKNIINTESVTIRLSSFYSLSSIFVCVFMEQWGKFLNDNMLPFSTYQSKEQSVSLVKNQYNFRPTALRMEKRLVNLTHYQIFILSRWYPTIFFEQQDGLRHEWKKKNTIFSFLYFSEMVKNQASPPPFFCQHFYSLFTNQRNSYYGSLYLHVCEQFWSKPMNENNHGKISLWLKDSEVLLAAKFSSVFRYERKAGTFKWVLDE